MKPREKGNSKVQVEVTKDSDDASSVTAVTAVTVDSDTDASSTVTLVDMFQDLAAIDSDALGDTSAESTDATSSQVSSGDEKSDDDGGEEKNGNAAESGSESAATGTTSEAASSEASSSEAASSEVASSDAAESTTSGETLSNEASSAASSNPGSWTDSEDALILSMKEGGETWAEIGKAINRGKNEVKKRWHVIKASSANSSDTQTDTAADSDKPSEDKPAEDKPAEEKKLTKAERKQKAREEKQAKAEKAAQEKADKEKAEAEKAEEKAKDEKKAKAKEAKQKKKEKAAKEPAPESVSSESEDEAASSSSYRARLALLHDTSSASDSASSATSGDDADAPGYYDRELARQERYIRVHVHPALYPPTARAPSPADKRQRRDDAILASVASRREATRWLEMQANFFNVTGRMVPLHLIKARCEAEEDRGKAAGVRSWASSVAGSHELLDPHECAEVPEDALVGDKD
ncbi:hypothetical protein CSOJ01_04912 [Colletotrichum sojae]|uniref:Myb-like domain-containing protein n=1 Tax=Colletotrichum sojae TaxID=2175907 RepID=A0A8H6MXR7_9PEZI|nr:hypothetical protein CSOJ01_04912 [Colletotrichum sojae]